MDLISRNSIRSRPKDDVHLPKPTRAAFGYMVAYYIGTWLLTTQRVNHIQTAMDLHIRVY